MRRARLRPGSGLSNLGYDEPSDYSHISIAEHTEDGKACDLSHMMEIRRSCPPEVGWVRARF
jgi:hypothetical protein